MEVRRREGFDKTHEYFLKQDDKELRILFGGNLDLYWHLINFSTDYEKEKNKDCYETFCITKENYTIYSLFKRLLEDIKDCNVFEPVTEEGLEYFEELFPSDETPEERCSRLNAQLRTSYEYNKLCDGNSATWRSDDEAFEISSRVKISEVEDTILLEFFRPALDQDQQRLFDNVRHTPGEVGIRFRNSGSVYTPFNLIFMKMYNNLSEYNPDYHQIHLAEIEYQKKLKLKKKDK